MATCFACTETCPALVGLSICITLFLIFVFRPGDAQNQQGRSRHDYEIMLWSKQMCGDGCYKWDNKFQVGPLVL